MCSENFSSNKHHQISTSCHALHAMSFLCLLGSYSHAWIVNLPYHLHRDVKKQQHEASLQEQQKVTARDAIKNVFKHTEQQKNLAKSLVRAKMELDLLVIDDKHVSLAHVDHSVMRAKAEQPLQGACAVYNIDVSQHNVVAHKLAFHVPPMLAHALVPLSTHGCSCLVKIKVI